MRAFAAKMLSDLAPLAQQSLGLSTGFKDLANRFGIYLPLESDSRFEILYPQEASSLGERSAWEEARHSAARSLGREWASRNPSEVARELAQYEAEAVKIGRRWPRLAPVVCEEIAETAGDPEAWAAAFLEERAPTDVLRPFLAKATAHWENLMDRCMESKAHRWLATELILESQAPSDDLLARALEQAEELPQVVETLCLQRRVPIPTLSKLLHHPHWETALAVAVGEWCASPREEIREEVQTEWRAAILRAQTEDNTAVPVNQSLRYWLGVILAEDSVLALDWLFRQLVEDRPFPSSADGPLGRAVSALDHSQRLQVLEALVGREVPRELLPLLVGQDAEIYRALLASDLSRSLHLEPLERVPDEAWMELALCALEAGFDIEAVAEAAFGGAFSYCGAGVEHWNRWVQAFTALDHDPRLDAKKIARLGRRLAEEKVVAARVMERQIAIHGY